MMALQMITFITSAENTMRKLWITKVALTLLVGRLKLRMLIVEMTIIEGDMMNLTETNREYLSGMTLSTIDSRKLYWAGSALSAIDSS